MHNQFAALIFTPKTKFDVSYFVFIEPGNDTYHVCIRKMSPRVSLVRTVHRGELDGIPNEEHWLHYI
jgi:hypothetical protein